MTKSSLCSLNFLADLIAGHKGLVALHGQPEIPPAEEQFCPALVLMHNHPSGDPTPSEADIRVTRDLIRAGQLLKIEVLDHVIIGNPKHASLRELGYFL